MKPAPICISLFVLLTWIPTTDATCTASDEPCLEGSGTCFVPVQLALSGLLNQAVASLSYGKYCGFNNKCQVVEKHVDHDPSKCKLKNKDHRKLRRYRRQRFRRSLWEKSGKIGKKPKLNHG